MADNKTQADGAEDNQMKYWNAKQLQDFSIEYGLMIRAFSTHGTTREQLARRMQAWCKDAGLEGAFPSHLKTNDEVVKKHRFLVILAATELGIDPRKIKELIRNKVNGYECSIGLLGELWRMS